MAALIRRLFKYLAYAAAAGVMLLALLVGIARLLLPLVPDYQEDIRTWAAQATGLEVRFEHISASWPIAGPAIQFLDVTAVAPEDHQTVFEAERLDIGISLIHLLRDRELTVSRISVETTEVEVRRDADGKFWLQGRSVADLLPERDPGQPLRVPELAVELRDVEVAYRDLARGADPLIFRVERLELRLDDTDVAVEGEVQLPPEFGERATVSTVLPTILFDDSVSGRGARNDASEWSVYATGDVLSLAQILQYTLEMPTPVASMTGNLVLWASFAGTDPTAVTAEFDLADIALAPAAGASAPAVVERYQTIRGRVEWARDGNGWLLAGTDLDLRRDGLSSPSSDFSLASRTGTAEGERYLQGNAEFIRLHDWYPILRAFASAEIRDEVLPAAISGDLSDVDVDLRMQGDADPEFDIEFRFEDFGVVDLAGGEGLTGIAGTLAADHAGGRLQVDSDEASLTMPALFAAPIEVERLEGFFVWRVTPDGVHILSDNIRVRTSFAQASSRFVLDFPRTGESAYLDLTASAASSSATGVVGLLPLRRFPPKVGEWLQRAIRVGRATGADIEVRGPMREFPFDRGEGVFRIGVDIVDGVLDYATGWPPVENLEGRLEFDGVGLYTRRNSAIYGGIPLLNVDVSIPDLRKGLLSVTGNQQATVQQALAFLRASPIGEAVGPALVGVSGSGQLQADVNLRLPVTRPQEYALQLDVVTEDSRLELDRVDFGLQRVAGSFTVRNTQFFADGLTAELLGEPVSIRLRPAAAGGLYSQFVHIDGLTPVRSWIEAFNLPQTEKFDGTIDWTALVMFPARQANGASPPLHILVRSDLFGSESRLPAPVAKAADARRAFELDTAFPAEGVMEVNGRLGGDLSWALQFEAIDGRWRVERGGVHAGSAAALLPLESGVEVSGRIDFLRVDDWLSLADGASGSAWQDLYNAAMLQVDRLSLLGQIFPEVRMDARRQDRSWQFDVTGPNLAGQLRLPFKPTNDEPAVLAMDRLWLLESDPGDSADGDPRSVIPVSVTADDFVMGQLHFGRLQTELRSTPSGVVADPIDLQSETFAIGGDAAWLVHPNDDDLQQSRLNLTLAGTDIATLLDRLGYGPVIEGESVSATADLTWEGAPGDDFLVRSSGQFSVDMRNGAVLSLEPGGGRLLGILSVTALPRRLALDFRDVTDEGLSFKTLRGDFTLDDGNAYTCNLSLQGSVADMGIVGRTGLKAEDYDQLAVVRPHVSNLFALGGAVVAGPAGGAAMLLFSQIFRKPLSQLGESYHRVTGSWEDPEVKQLQGSEVNVTPLKNCEAYLEEALARPLQQ